MFNLVSVFYDVYIFFIILNVKNIMAAFLLQLEFGVVYSCIEDKMYTGKRGKGAFCNGKRLQVSGQTGRGQTCPPPPNLKPVIST